MKTYENGIWDEERALYGLEDAVISSGLFDGPADGESALKECRRIAVKQCEFRLRYPLWHVRQAEITQSFMHETCRAPMWYDEDLTLTDCTVNGIKSLRESTHILIRGCRIDSEEFGWFCRDLQISNTRLESVYPFLRSRDMTIDNLTMKAKYAFQYIENVRITHSELDTKDAFWHSRNVTVEDSVIKGEYLGWYSENLRLVRCKIVGTQPLCYARSLTLEDCEMVGGDLSFERSEVNATVCGHIDSVKNPLGGCIEADSIGDIIQDGSVRTDTPCRIILR